MSMRRLYKVYEDTPSLRPPTAGEIRAAAGRSIPNVIAPDLSVLFCGINPGLYSAAAQHHFARPGNRFWPALHLAGFTSRVLAPNESHDLLQLGYGITSLVPRAACHGDCSRDSGVRTSGRAAEAHRYSRDPPPTLGRHPWCGCLSRGVRSTAGRDRPAANSSRGHRHMATSKPKRSEWKLPIGGSCR